MRFFGGICHAIPPVFFVNSPGTNALGRTFDAAVALAISKNDDAATPDKEGVTPEQEGATLEDEAVFTVCLKSGCSMICLTRLSKLAGAILQKRMVDSRENL